MQGYRIAHDIRCRIRFSLQIKHLSVNQADKLQYYFEGMPEVLGVKVFERTADIVVVYNGSRQSIIAGLRAFTWNDEKTLAHIPRQTGRALNSMYWDKMVSRVLWRGIRYILMPRPIRNAVTLVKAAPFIIKGVKSLRYWRINVDVLDAVSIVASLITGDFKTASSVIFLLQIGEILEEWTYRKSVDDLARSMDLGVTQVWQVDDDGKRQVPVDAVAQGECIVVEMGNMIPLDGQVIAGKAMVNQAALTGEAVPVRKYTTTTVYAGTVVEEGTLVIEVKNALGDTRYERIMTMIEEGERLKSSVQNKAENLADRLVPYTFIGAAAVWILTRNLGKMLSVLMVDFSCALKLSVPLVVLSAIREASNQQITVKGGKFLENVTRADTLVFDKTGTLTKARPTVKDVVAFEDRDPGEMLRIAACLEEHFPHSMAHAVVDAAKARDLHHEEMHSEVEYLVAHGIVSAIQGQRVIIGSRHFVFEDEGVVTDAVGWARLESLPRQHSHLFLGINGELAATICIEDPIRQEVPGVVAALKERGISRIVMMTGDSERTAKAVAELAGIDEYHAEVLPEDKAAFVEAENAAGRRVIMVGDGINDSPALSVADVGIAIDEGADIAREIADITISQDNLNKLVVLKDLSDGMLGRINGHYRFIVGFNLGVIAGGVTGIFSPGTAALLHNSSTLGISLHGMTNILK
ncbi:heavy metal translocating P-type ATPase [Eubacterium aggregans]|uniref:heavy metal translocating P-type ATPase n=1 Tax=Eubacterium aggregans TaxID=81409 RepID=UPI003F3694F2